MVQHIVCYRVTHDVLYSKRGSVTGSFILFLFCFYLPSVLTTHLNACRVMSYKAETGVGMTTTFRNTVPSSYHGLFCFCCHATIKKIAVSALYSAVYAEC